MKWSLTSTLMSNYFRMKDYIKIIKAGSPAKAEAKNLEPNKATPRVLL